MPQQILGHAGMNWWRKVIIQRRCAVLTACAAGFLMLIGCSISEPPEPLSPLTYQGVTIAPPPIEETSDQTAEAEAVDSAILQPVPGGPTTILPSTQGLHGGPGSDSSLPTWAASASGVHSAARNQIVAAGIETSRTGPGISTVSALAAVVDQSEIWRAAGARHIHRFADDRIFAARGLAPRH